MSRAEIIAVKTIKEKDKVREELIPVSNITNPTILPMKGDIMNFQGERFEVTAIEWIPLRETVNIYIAYNKDLND